MRKDTIVSLYKLLAKSKPNEHLIKAVEVFVAVLRNKKDAPSDAVQYFLSQPQALLERMKNIRASDLASDLASEHLKTLQSLKEAFENKSLNEHLTL